MSLIQGFSLKDMFVGGKKTAKKHPKKHSKKSAKKGGYKKRKTMKKRPKKVKGGSSNYHDAYGAGDHNGPTEEGPDVDSFKGHPEPFTEHGPNPPSQGENKDTSMTGGKKHKGKKHKRKTHKKKGGYEPTGVVTAALLTAAHMKKKGKKPKK